MADSSRAGTVPAGSSISTDQSGGGGGGQAGDVSAGGGRVAGVATVGVRVPGVSGVAQMAVGVGVSGVAVEGIGVSLGISRPLGDVDHAGRVGNVAAGTSVSTSDSGDSSVGEAECGEGGGGRDLGVAGGNRGGHGVSVRKASVGKSGDHGGGGGGLLGLLHLSNSGGGDGVGVRKAGVRAIGVRVASIGAQTSVAVSPQASIAVGSVQKSGVGLSIGLGSGPGRGSQTEDSQELVHVDCSLI